MPQSTASSPSSTPPPTASPGQVCQVSGHKTDPSRPVRMRRLFAHRYGSWRAPIG